MMATKTKLTREERNEQARQERIAQKVAEFKQGIERARGKRVYSDQAAFEHDAPVGDIKSQRFDGSCPTCGQGFARSGIALYELVRDYRWKKEQMLKLIARVEENVADARRRMAQNDRPAWYSNGILGGTPQELDRLEQEVWTLRECIARLAWATNWYVPEIMTDRENAQRERMLGLRVEHDPTQPEIVGEHPYNAWRVYIGEQVLTQALLHALTGYGEDGNFEPITYRSEQSAWTAAAQLVGERLD